MAAAARPCCSRAAAIRPCRSTTSRRALSKLGLRDDILGGERLEHLSTSLLGEAQAAAQAADRRLRLRHLAPPLLGRRTERRDTARQRLAADGAQRRFLAARRSADAARAFGLRAAPSAPAALRSRPGPGGFADCRAGPAAGPWRPAGPIGPAAPATVAGSDAWISWTLLDGMTLPWPAVTSSTLASIAQSRNSSEADATDDDDQRARRSAARGAVGRGGRKGSDAMTLSISSAISARQSRAFPRLRHFGPVRPGPAARRSRVRR